MILNIPIAKLRPNSLNPRTHYDQQALAELAASIKADGVLENLIVRPDYCVGTITENQLRSATPEAGALNAPAYEVVSGDRRLKAALVVLEATACIECRVVEKTDPEALRINLAEQIQRNQLTPLEEAAGFERMLSYRSAEGDLLHTVASLASGLGVEVDYVNERRRLLSAPKSIQTALAEGRIGLRTAAIVATVPSTEQREAFAKEVLTAGREGSALTAEEARELLNERYVVGLACAPFNTEDGSLCPDDMRAANPTGLCSACPHRTTGGGQGKSGNRANRCTHTPCFQAKCRASLARHGAAALDEGYAVLTIEDSRRLFETHRPTELRVDGDFADISTPPAGHLLKSEVKDPPLWRELVEKAVKAGLKPELVFAADGELRPRWLVKTAPLIAAAEQIGEPIFRGAKGEPVVPRTTRPGEDEDDRFRREQRELAEKQKQATLAQAEEKRRAAVVLAAGVRAVHAALVKSWVPASVWDVMLDLILAGNQVPMWHLLADLLVMKRETPSAKLRAELDKRRQQEQQACVPLLLATQSCAIEGIASRELAALAKHAGVSLSAVEKEARAAMEQKPAKRKAPKPKAGKPKPANGGAGAKAVRAVKASLKKGGAK